MWQFSRMLPTRQGSLRLFRIAGIDLYLHWSWFLVAAYEISSRSGGYSSVFWNALEYLSLFAIVLLHEFGHALACRQVGGTANQIVLWPLGGVAYVSPPQRPGATLWSIAAGPLVNVALSPIFVIAWVLSRAWGWPQTMPDVHVFLRTVLVINTGLLVFNLLPVYPLDGGQILRSLLWFVIGRARSLMVASIVGLVGVAGLATLALVWLHSGWLGIVCAFIALQCWMGFKNARILARAAQVPRRPGFACPSCHTAPPIGPFWLCTRCQARFDTFVTLATCPQCTQPCAVTPCLDCQTAHPMAEWIIAPPISPSP